MPWFNALGHSRAPYWSLESLIFDGADHTRAMLPARVRPLVGHHGPACADTELRKLEEYGQAAYALGIAVGLLVRPETFATGGSR